MFAAAEPCIDEVDDPMSGDDAATASALANHLAVGAEDRDAKWRHRFYDLIDRARFHERDQRITIGADGFPYFTLDVPRAGQTPGTIEIAALIAIATSCGFGIVVEAPGAQAVPWIFSCGDLVGKRAFGSYEFPRIGVPAASAPVVRNVRRDAMDISIGAPPATLLPGFVQPLLRRFFEHRLQIAAPGALAMLCGHHDPPEQLVFRISRADFAGERELAAALAGITWFLPRHTVVSVLAPEIVAELDRAFVPLLG